MARKMDEIVGDLLSARQSKAEAVVNDWPKMRVRAEGQIERLEAELYLASAPKMPGRSSR